MKSFFVGSKTKPSFLVEVSPKKICVYKPDSLSKNESFYETYSLGKKVLDTNYTDIIFETMPVSYKHHYYVPYLIRLEVLWLWLLRAYLAQAVPGCTELQSDTRFLLDGSEVVEVTAGLSLDSP
jgi:hypothetical protein